MNERILCVDDEPAILDGFQRNLRRRFEVVTEASAEKALKMIAAAEPFVVIVSDMKMPEMDGIRFLSRARDISPDSVRIMLTGMSDLKTAMEAVNEGNIFRFLTKPCPVESLLTALDAAVAQYRLVMAERELLENTLKGSVKVLIDVLGLTNPAAFSRSMRIKHLVAQVVKVMKLPGAWRFEVAAMLSQLGCVTIPAEVLEHMLGGAVLSEVERKMVNEHPAIGKNLICSIPRLEAVAEMIFRQTWRYADIRAIAGYASDPACVGGAILKAVIDYDAMLYSGLPPARALELMHRDRDAYNMVILDILAAAAPLAVEHEVKALTVSELKAGMVLAEDVRSRNGVLILAKGQEVTDALRRRLENCLVQGTLDNVIRVQLK